MMKKITLRNKVEMDVLGFGTYKLAPEDTPASITSALKAGYRLIDTATYYQNEAEIGQTLVDLKINRQDVFITSKVWNDFRTYDEVMQQFHQSLIDLQTSYLDCYLVHWPINMNPYVWKALEDCYSQQKVRAIGVSNFNKEDLEALLSYATIKPMINQIQQHHHHSHYDAHQLCQQEHIVLQAWSPLNRGKDLNHPILVQLAQKYHKTTAQILLRFQIDRDFMVVVKSKNPQRIEENINIFDFSLTSDEVKQIESIDC